MKKKSTILLLGMTLFSLQLLAQSPNLTGANSVTFSNSNPCIISVVFDYTNNGTADITSSFKNALYLTDDLFFADPAFDILVGEVTNSQGCNIGEQRTVSFLNQDISQLPGFNSGVTYSAYVFLDRDEEISESDEDDNLHAVGSTTCITVGVEDALAETVGITLFPNPAADRVHLGVETPVNAAIGVTISDLHGKIIYTRNSAPEQMGMEDEIDTSNWASGMYLVLVQVEGTVIHKKLSVE